MAEVARRADLRPSQLYRWRRDLAAPGRSCVCGGDREPGAAFLPEQQLATVLDLCGAVLRIAADESPALVAAVVRSLRR